VDTTIGNLGLTNEQENQLVAFLKTLTDGYGPSTVKRTMANAPRESPQMKPKYAAFSALDPFFEVVQRGFWPR